MADVVERFFFSLLDQYCATGNDALSLWRFLFALTNRSTNITFYSIPRKHHSKIIVCFIYAPAITIHIVHCVHKFLYMYTHKNELGKKKKKRTQKCSTPQAIPRKSRRITLVLFSRTGTNYCIRFECHTILLYNPNSSAFMGLHPVIQISKQVARDASSELRQSSKSLSPNLPNRLTIVRKM